MINTTFQTHTDEAALSKLMGMYSAAMLRTALIYVHDRFIAEEVMQETWVAVLRGLDRFEGRSSLKTWIFSILIHRSITRAKREGRFISLSHLTENESDDFEPSITSDGFQRQGHFEAAFYAREEWSTLSWDGIPEERLVKQEMVAHIHAAINRLPPLQQRVIHMRDVEGWSATEVCAALALTEINQRVILHRARAKVRQILDGYLRVD